MKLIITTEEELRALISEAVRAEFANEKALREQMAMPNKTGHYTTKEICSLFNISRGTASNWERKGILKPVIVSRKKTYLNADIAKLIEQKQLKKRS